MKKRRLNEAAIKLDRLFAAVVLVLMLAFMLCLTGAAFFETSYISTALESGEQVVIKNDNFFVNLIFLSLILTTFYLFYRYGKPIKTKKLELILMLWVFVLGVSFIASVKLSAPWYSDSYILTSAARHAARDDLSSFGAYFSQYPFQLGYVFYAEIFFRITALIAPGMPEGYYCIALQGVNLLLLMASYHALMRISSLLFSDTRAEILTLVFLALCLPPVLSCTFLYGNIPSFAFGIGAVWMFLSFLKGKKLLHGVLCALFLGISVALKLNLLIFFVAIAAVWVVDILRHWSFRSLLCLALSVLSVLTVSKLPQNIYELRSGESFGKGIPMIAWMAMGMSEGHAGPGWYSEEHTVTVFKELDGDSAATAENAEAVLKERLAYFKSNPKEALSFFAVKVNSQWNEPSYESLWINDVQNSYGEKGGLYNVFCGSGEKRSLAYMNQFQQLIFLGVLLSLIQLWKKRDTRSSLLLVIILGGLTYHLLFEAKSQYALSYFMLMIPMAASGYSMLFRGVEYR